MEEDNGQQPSKSRQGPRVTPGTSPVQSADAVGELTTLLERVVVLLPTALDQIRAASKSPLQDRNSVGFPAVSSGAEPAIQTCPREAAVPPSPPGAEVRHHPENPIENPPSSACPDFVDYCKAAPCSNAIPENTKRKKYCSDDCLKRAQRRRSAELKREYRMNLPCFKDDQQLVLWKFFLRQGGIDPEIVRGLSREVIATEYKDKVREGQRLYEKQYRTAHLEQRKSQVREAVRRYRLNGRHK